VAFSKTGDLGARRLGKDFRELLTTKPDEIQPGFFDRWHKKHLARLKLCERVLACRPHGFTICGTLATRLVPAGADMESVPVLMGHSTIKTTEKYFHSDRNQRKSAVARMKATARQARQNVQQDKPHRGPDAAGSRSPWPSAGGLLSCERLEHGTAGPFRFACRLGCALRLQALLFGLKPCKKLARGRERNQHLTLAEARFVGAAPVLLQPLVKLSAHTAIRAERRCRHVRFARIWLLPPPGTHTGTDPHTQPCSKH
jgi:hypothetical protein